MNEEPIIPPGYEHHATIYVVVGMTPQESKGPAGHNLASDISFFIERSTRFDSIHRGASPNEELAVVRALQTLRHPQQSLNSGDAIAQADKREEGEAGAALREALKVIVRGIRSPNWVKPRILVGVSQAKAGLIADDPDTMNTWPGDLLVYYACSKAGVIERFVGVNLSASRRPI